MAKINKGVMSSDKQDYETPWVMLVIFDSKTKPNITTWNCRNHV
jgi:hypothetical protein